MAIDDAELRQVCEKLNSEQDPAKLSELIKQLHEVLSKPDCEKKPTRPASTGVSGPAAHHS